MGIGERKMILAILGIGLVFRLISLNQSLWLDEAINVMAAKSYSFLGMMTQYAVADFHPPLWFITLWSWGKLFGYSEIVVRLPSVFFGVLTIYITYLIGKKLVSQNFGILAALLLSINPLHIYYSQEARMYALAALAVSLNMLFFIEFIKGDKGNWGKKGNRGVYVLSSLLVIASDYVAYLIFPAQLIFLVLSKKFDMIKEWLIRVCLAGLLFVWWVPVFLNQLTIGSAAVSNVPTWANVVGTIGVKPLVLTYIKFIIGRISFSPFAIYVAIFLPVGLFFLHLIWRGYNFTDKFIRNLLTVWLLVPIILAALVSLLIPVYSYFRLLYILPGFVILIASGIWSFKDKLRYTLLGTVVLIELFCVLVYLLNPNYQREDWKGLVSFFKSIQPSIILFESSGTFPPFDYYAGDSLNAKGALKDFPVKDESKLLDLGKVLGGMPEVYLVDYMVEITDPNRKVSKKLTDLGYRQADTKDFHGVGFVYHYVK